MSTSALQLHTAAGTSQSVVLAEWVKVFPRQVCETYTSSVTFMKQLTTVALSTILYLKNMFPVENYRIEKFGGLKLTILKKQCMDELAQFISTALTQAFEAFDKKYLHQLALCFYDSDSNITEYHVFEYTYKSDEVVMDFHSKNGDNVTKSAQYTFDNVRERTITLIRTCVVLSQTFPEQKPADVTLHLYYNEDAPPGYQAPGFVPPSSDEAVDPLESGSADEVLVGWVETPFHSLRANVFVPDNISYSNKANASLDAPVITQNESQKGFSGVEHGISSEENAVRILCSCNKDFIADEIMLTCKYCGTQQHASCYGVPRAAARHVRHCCMRCCNTDPTGAPAAEQLLKMPLKQRESLSVYRLALSRCAMFDRMSVSQLASDLHLSQRTAANLFKLLHNHGVLLPGDNLIDSPREIDQEKLKHLINKNLPYSGDTDMVDRLVAESLSQGSQPDPVSDVLNAMDRVTLQNTLGNSVEYKPERVVGDSTLKQYRDAILSFDQRMDEELPLNDIRPEKIIKKIGKKLTKRKNDDSTNKQLMSELKTKKTKAMPN